jgi:ketosteroid isomerase-like protein
MPPRHLLVIALSLGVGPATAADVAEAPSLPVLSADECAVWQRELSFARSVAEHDATAFAGHVDEQAAFASSRREPQRGRATIVSQWAPLIAGVPVRVEWYPTRVTIGGPGDVAWSSGPALYEDTTPGAAERYRLGGFHSVWHRGADGQWRVLFDDGVRSVPATAEQVAAFHAGRRDCTSLTSP